jgi:hypothetical protein
MVRRVVILACLLAAAPIVLAAQGAAPSLPVELFAGRLHFAEAVAPGEVDVAGARLGVDVGGFTGVRGFYWQRVAGGVPVQAYGGEAQVNLNAGNGVTPFLVGGIARLDFLGAGEAGAPPPEDRTLPLAGGGLRLDVGRFGVQGALRSYFTHVDGDDGARDLRHSTLWSAGLAFRLGRGARPAPALRPAAAPAEVRYVRGDTVFVVQRDTLAPEHFISIPIPREGEIYLRYGPAGESRIAAPGAGDAAGQVDEALLERLRRQIVADLEPVLRSALAAERADLREMVRAEVARVPPGLTPEAERRLLERIEAAVVLRLRDELARAALQGDTAGMLLPRVDTVLAADTLPPRFQPRFRGLRPYAGGNLDRPRQFVAGLRLDLGPFSDARPRLRLVPEAALGVGQGGTSVMLTANAVYEANPLALRGAAVQPYAYGGLGFLFFGREQVRRPQREAVLNLGYGLLAPIPNHRAEFFVEHQGIDLFDLNRVLFGVRF